MLVCQFGPTNFSGYDLHIVTGVAPAARARNQGAAASSGDLIAFIDDDAFLGHPRVLAQLVACLDADPTIGVVGSSKLLPPDATPLQRRIAAEVPRWTYPIMERDTESNPPLDQYGFTGITTTCCVLRRCVFKQLGGYDERFATGEDTEFFYRVRQAGYRFVIPAHCWVYHDPPKRVSALLRKSFRYGVGHAHEARQAPARQMNLIPLDRWYGKLFVLLSPLLFVPSLFVHLYFEPQRRIEVGFRPLKTLSTFATLYGYTWGWFRGSA